MHIAVVVPAYNVAAFLPDAMRSVLRQTHTSWTMIVVDDGSTDATPAVAATFQDSRIVLIRQANAGVSAARNRGIHRAGDSAPDAFLFLDGDDWLVPDALARLAGTLDAAPWAVAACGRYARVAAGGGAIRLSPAPPDGCLLERLLIRNLFANGGHLLIRREAIETAGDFRRDLTYGEDWEYWTRLAMLGEFAAVRGRSPLLFVRERAGSAYRVNAADPAAYRPVIDAIHRNPAVASRIGSARLADLTDRAGAEIAWTVGRELIRHGSRQDGVLWLVRSLRQAPSLKRLIVAGLSWRQTGPFAPYRTPV